MRQRIRLAGVAMAVSAAVTLVGCGLGVYDGFTPLRPTDNFHVIEPGEAYRSAQLDAQTLKLVVETYGIATVINLRGDNTGQKWYDNEKAALDELGVRLVNVRMSAHALPPRAELLTLYDTFRTAEGPILVHCKGGADRSGAAAAIWRMMKLGESRDTAAAHELTPLYGHFQAFTPEMDELVAMFQPDRDWILNDYPVD